MPSPNSAAELELEAGGQGEFDLPLPPQDLECDTETLLPPPSTDLPSVESSFPDDLPLPPPLACSSLQKESTDDLLPPPMNQAPSPSIETGSDLPSPPSLDTEPDLPSPPSFDMEFDLPAPPESDLEPDLPPPPSIDTGSNFALPLPDEDLNLPGPSLSDGAPNLPSTPVSNREPDLPAAQSSSKATGLPKLPGPLAEEIPSPSSGASLPQSDTEGGHSSSSSLPPSANGCLPPSANSSELAEAPLQEDESPSLGTSLPQSDTKSSHSSSSSLRPFASGCLPPSANSSELTEAPLQKDKSPSSGASFPQSDTEGSHSSSSSLRPSANGCLPPSTNFSKLAEAPLQKDETLPRISPVIGSTDSVQMCSDDDEKSICGSVTSTTTTLSLCAPLNHSLLEVLLCTHDGVPHERLSEDSTNDQHGSQPRTLLDMNKSCAMSTAEELASSYCKDTATAETTASESRTADNDDEEPFRSRTYCQPESNELYRKWRAKRRAKHVSLASCDLPHAECKKKHAEVRKSFFKRVVARTALAEGGHQWRISSSPVANIGEMVKRRTTQFRNPNKRSSSVDSAM